MRVWEMEMEEIPVVEMTMVPAAMAHLVDNISNMKYSQHLNQYIRLFLYAAVTTLLTVFTFLGIQKNHASHSSEAPQLINTALASHFCSAGDGGGTRGGDDNGGDSGGGGGSGGGGASGGDGPSCR